MRPTEDNSLEDGYTSSVYDSSLEAAAPPAAVASAYVKRISPFRLNKNALTITATAVASILLITIGAVLFSSHNKGSNLGKSPSASYAAQGLSLQGLKTDEKLAVGTADHLAVNGQLQVADTIVLAPTETPENPLKGQIYYDKTTNTPYYYNGTTFVSLSPSHVTSLGGASGVLGIGDGLQITANSLALSTQVQQSLTNINSVVNTPKVTSLQGLTGNVTLNAGSGIGISGTTITNDGVISLVSGSGTLLVTDDGNGNYTVTEAGSGASGSVALGPVSAQADASNNPAIHVNKTGTGNFLQFANNGTDTFVVSQTGSITTGTIPYTQVQGRPATVVNSIGGSSGALTLGAGLGVVGTTLSNTGVTSLTGTANQITVSAATGGVTLSLPQNIATTSSPVFTGLRLSGLSTGLVTSNGTGVLASGVLDRNSSTYFNTALSVSNGGTGAANFATNGVLLGNGSSALQVVTAASNGLCFMSSGSGPVFQSCPVGGNLSYLGGVGESQTAGRLVKFGTTANSVTDSLIADNGTTVDIWGDVTLQAAHTITGNGSGLTNVNALTLQGNSASAFEPAITTLPVNKGGTGAGNFATGGVLIGNGTGAVQVVTSASAGLCFLSTAGNPAFQTCPSGGNISYLGGAGESQTSGRLTKFGATANSITDSLLADNGTTVTVFGELEVASTHDLTLATGQTVFADNLTVTSGGSGITVSASTGTTGNITFVNDNGVGGTNSFVFPTSGGMGQIICTSGITCAAGAGQAVTLEPAGVQTANANTTAIFVNKQSGTGNLLELQAAGSDALVINGSGSTTIYNATSVRGALTLGVASTTTGSVSFKNSTNSNTVTLQGAAGGSGYTLTLPSAVAGTNGQCLTSTTGGVLSFSTCLSGSGSGGGVTDVNGDSGAIVLQGTANQITITDSPSGTLTFTTPQNINTTANVTFNSVTVGVAGTTAGSLVLASTGVGSVTLSSNAQANAVALKVPTDANATDEICLLSLANCVGTGGGLTGTGTNGKIAKFTASNTLADSGLSESGSTLTYAGNQVINAGAGFVGNLLDLQVNGVSKLSVNQAGALTLATPLTVANGGTGAGTFTSNGIIYGNGTGALSVTSAAANSILATNGSSIPGLTQTLPTAVQGNITSTGALTSGSIASGFGTISTGNNITTTAALQGGSLSIASGAFAVNASGAITAATGITSSGTIVFSGLGTGVVHSTSGTLSVADVALTTETSGNYIASIGTATGLTIGGTNGVEGGVPTLSVTYGSGANTAVQGNTTLTCPSGTGNLTGGGTSITLGTGGSCAALDTVASPSFTGNVTAQGGNVTVGVAGTTAGSIKLANASNSNLVIIQGTAPAGGNVTLSLPGTVAAGTDTICLQTAANCSGAGASSIGTIDTGGTPVANGAVIASNVLYLQSATGSFPGLVNTASQTFGGNKTFNGSVILAASQSLSLTGGNTASRPGSPTEGMLYYDTTTKSLLVYANGKWQADRSTASKIVGTSASGGVSTAVASQNADAADYVNTSTTSAQTTINTAISSLSATGGTVYLMEGTYIIDGSITMASNVKLVGTGQGTILKVKNATNAGLNLISASSLSNIEIRDLVLEGNRTNNSSGTQHGINIAATGSGSGTTAVPGFTVTNITAQNFRTDGITLSSAVNNSSITDSNFINNGTSGIAFSSTASNYIKVTGNTVQGSGGIGIDAWNPVYSTINDNIVEENGGVGIKVASGTNDTISGNTVRSNTSHGMQIDSNNNTITANNLITNSGDGIFLNGSTGSTVSGNTLTSNTSRGIEVNASSDVVTGNRVTSSGASGIYLHGSSNQATGNTITGGTTHGIQVGGNTNTVSGNTVTSNSQDGIHVDSANSNQNLIIGNTVNTNTQNGIVIDNSSQNQVEGNRIHDNGGSNNFDAIKIFSNLSSPDKNTVTGNVITDTAGTGYAIDLTGGNPPSNTYLADNTYSGTGATVINDTGTGTIYGGQLNDNSDFVLQGSTRILAQEDLESTGFYNNGNGGIGQFGNLLTYSEQLDNAIWIKTNNTVTADSTTAPDGQTTAELLNSTASNGSVTQTSGTASGSTYTFSVWLKSSTAGTNRNVSLRIDGATTGTGTAKSIIATPTWQRYYVIQDTSTFTGNVKADIIAATSSDDVYAWGAQLASGSSPLAYARATASAITASSGVISNGGLFVSAVNASDKPLIVQGAPSQAGDLVQLQDSAGNVNAAFNAAGNQLTLGRIAASGTVTQGKIVLGDGTTDNFGLTLQAGTMTASRTYTLPDSPGNATDTFCLLTLNNCSGSGASSVGTIDTGGTPVANGAVISAGVLYLQSATASFPGLVNTTTQTLAGAKTFSSLLTGSAGLAVTGAITNINASSNFATNINTGSSNGAVTIGNSSAGAITLQSGSVINIGANATAQTITVGNSSGATSVVLNAGTGAVNIGSNATDHTTTLGSVTGASITNLQGGTGGINIGTSNVAQTIQIGNTANAVAQTINIGNNATASSSTTLNIGSAIGTSPVTLASGTSGIAASSTATTGTVFNIQGNNLTTGTGLKVGSTSALATSANIAAFSQTGSYTTPLAVSGNVLNVSRSVSANVATGAITFDSPGSGNGVNVASISWNHTVNAFSNRVLVVAAQANHPHSTVTYGGTPLTQISYSGQTSLWILVNPPIGTASVVFTTTGGAAGNSITGESSSWYNVDQTTPNGAAAYASGNSATASVAVSSAASEVVVDSMWTNFGFGYSPSGGQTLIANPAAANGSGSSYKAGAASTTMSWTVASSTWEIMGVGLKPSSASYTLLSGAVQSLSSNCTGTSCQDTSNILNLNQQFAGASGAVLSLQNAGTGADIQLGGGTIKTANGTTSTAVSLLSGNASAGASGSITIDSGTATTTTGVISIGTSNSRSITIGNGTGATQVNIQCGTAACNIGNNSVAHSTILGSLTGAADTYVQGGTGGVFIGWGGIANTIQIGNTTGAVAQTINIGNNATVSSTNTIVIGSTIGTSPVTIQSGTSGVLVKGANGTTAFQVQNASSSVLLSADTTNMRVGIGTSTPFAQLTVAGQTPVLVGTSATVTGARFAFAQGRYVYVSYTNGFRAIDVSDPANPTALTAVNPGFTAYSVYVSGKYAYLAGGSSFRIYDISNPNAPAATGAAVALPNASNNTGLLYVQGRYAYIGISNGTGTVQVYDVANPANPILASSFSLTATYLADSLTGQGNYLYVTEYNGSVGQMQILDISNPASLSVKGTLSGMNIPTIVSVQGRYAYVSDGSGGGVKVVSVSDPTSPSVVGTFSDAANNYVFAQGRYVYTFSNTNVKTVDVSTPGTPVQFGSNLTLGSGPVQLYVQGRYEFIANTTAGSLQILDLGGAYVQQLEAGGIETGTLNTRSNAQIGNDLDVKGGLTVGANTQLSGNLGVAGQVLLQNTANSTTAFQIQNASAASLLNADTTNMNLTLNGANSGALASTGFTATGGSSGSINVGAANKCRMYASSVTANGYVYEIGGNEGGCNATTIVSTVYYARLNSDGTIPATGSTGTWSAATSLPGVRELQSSVVYDGYLYVIGGSDDGTTAKSTVYYAKLNADGTLGSWNTNASSGLAARMGHTSIVVNGYIYVIGGWTGVVTSSNVYYAKINADGSVGTWNTTTSGLTAAAAYHTSVTSNGYIYVMGGNTTNTMGGTNAGTTANTYYARPSSTGDISTWTSTTAITSARQGHASVVQNGYVYVIGGSSNNAGASINSPGTSQTTVYYAPLNAATGAIGSWSTSTALTTAIDYGTAVNANGYIYSLGGYTSGTGTTQSTVNYTSGSRIKVGGSLDLVGLGGASLNDPGSGGELTAGNTNIVGTLQAAGDARFAQNVAVAGDISGTGTLAISNSNTNSATVSVAGFTQNPTFTSATSLTGNTLNATRANVVNTGAITLDTPTTGSVSGNSNTGPLTFSHTVPATSNRVLLVAFTSSSAGAYTVTYSGQSMTLAVTASDGNGDTVRIYYLVAPPVGTANVVITNTTLGNFTSNAIATNWSNVNQTTPISHTATNGAFGGSPTVTVTSATGEVVVDTVGTGLDNLSAATAGQTEIRRNYLNLAGSETSSSYKAGAASTSLSWGGTATHWNSAAVSLAPNALTVTGAAASISSNCTVTAGACTDSSNVLNLNQQYASATGAVLQIQNSGTGASIQGGNGSGSNVAGQALTIAGGQGTGSAVGGNLNFQIAKAGGAGSSLNNLATVFSLSGTDGSAIFKNATNGTTAFQIQNASAANLFQVDTTNNNLTLAGNNSGEVQAWSTNANALPSGRLSSSSVVANGYVYIIGGQSGLTYFSTVFYAKLNSDGSTGAWSTNTNALPAVRSRLTTVAANGYIYAIGGQDGGFNVQSTVYYAKLNSDGSTGTWSTAANALPGVRYQHTSVVANGYVYVIGGRNSGSAQSTVYYAKLNSDGSVGAWSTAGNALPAAVYDHSSVVANGYVYTVGGRIGVTAQTIIYYSKLNGDGSVGAWSTAVNGLPAARYDQSSVVANGYVYSFGGEDSSPTPQTSVYYSKLNGDGSVGAWSTAANSLPAVRQMPSSVVANGYVYAIGGADGVGNAQTSVYYASVSRIKVGGSLDLVGLQGQNLADAGSQGLGSSGGSITAGDGIFVGNLQVQGQSTLQGVAINGALNVGGGATIQTLTNTTAAFQVQNATGNNLLSVDTVGNGVTVGSAGLAGTLQIGNTTGAVAQTINIGNNATASSATTLNIGSAIGTSPVTIASGTSGIATSSTATTSNALSLQGNSLTTGTGLSVSTTSANQISGNLAFINSNNTYTNALNTTSGTLNVARTTTANISSTSVQLDNSTSFNTNTNTYSYTVGNFSNRILIVGLHRTGAQTVTSMTYAGQAMTELTAGGRSQIWYLVAPPVGTANVVITESSAVGVVISSWYNVNQATPLGALASATATSTAASVTASAASGDVVYSNLASSSATIPTPTAGQTVIATPVRNSITEVGEYLPGAASVTFTSTVANALWDDEAVALKTIGSSAAVTVTGAVATISNSCTTTNGICADSSNVLNLNQQYATASGAVLALQNAGTGAAVALTQTGSSTVDIQLATGTLQTAGGATSNGVKLQSGNATAGSSGTAILQSGSGTTGTGAITIQSGNASAGASGNITIDTGTFTSGTPTINIGTANAAAISIGRSGQATTVNGTLTVTQAVTFNSTLTVKAVTINGHIITGNTSGSTTASPDANAGTSATCTISGNDTGGQITLVTGSGSWSAGTQCTVTFATSFASAPHPVISVANGASATYDVSTVVPYIDATTTTMTLNFKNADNAANTYYFNYFNAQ